MKKPYKRKCKICKVEFEAKRKTAKTCGNKCRQALWYKNSKKVKV